MRGKSSYDYYLILATTVVLFVISAICIYGMFYFKLAQVHQLPVAEKVGYMDSMNTVLAPFLIALIVLLGICVPKRLLPTSWLNWFSLVLVLLACAAGFIWGLKASLAFVLMVSCVLQMVVLFMALAGSKELNFEKRGYWVRVGSSLLHLGLILFTLDLFFYRYQVLHQVLFWITTISVLVGMVFCFYAESFSRLEKRKGSHLNY
ncbi:MAG: hypothetical protein KAJ00_06440 [Deltaproteobacteria bacterium]|nr:hypothetical protein [Deltaproteobacteria bacterium]